MFLKRTFDLLTSIIALVVLSPILIITLLAVFLQDFKSPFYLGQRVGRFGKPFRMVKIRSMVSGAYHSGVDSTVSDDPRITPIGAVIRRYKLDEVSQLWNVMLGHMSLVGPRPQVVRDVALYTDVERELLKIRPGITDLASVVFADEGEILKSSEDPDLRYHQIIRPWKSRLALLYRDNSSLVLDLKIITATVFSIVSRQRALRIAGHIVKHLRGDDRLVSIASRNTEPYEFPPPGAVEVVRHRT